MARYTYECETCGEEIEVSHSMSDDTLYAYHCPVCDKLRRVKRLISKTSFALHGRGWYSDSYGGESNRE